MKKKKVAAKKAPRKSKVRITDDFRPNDRGQSYAMDINEKNPALAKFAERKVRAR